MHGIETDRPCHEGSTVRVHYHRLSVVVRERVIEERLDDPIDTGGRRGAGQTGWLRPQFQVAEDLLDDGGVVQQGDQFYLSPAVRADERVNFPDFLDEFAPLR